MTPEQVRAHHAEARVRERVRAILTRAYVDPYGYDRAVAFAASLADDAGLFLDSGPIVDRIAALIGHKPSAWQRGLIIGLALALASEEA